MQETILTLSASRVKCFQSCKRKYYYQYIKKLPRKQWDHFDLGTLVHGALEHFHGKFKKDGQQDNLKKLMKLSFKKQREDMEFKRTIPTEILLLARDLLVQYLKNMENDGIGSEIVSLEEKFNIPLNDKYSILGFVDRLDLDEDGVYHIKDYKTNKNMKYMDPFQLQTYGIYLKQKFSDISAFRGSYIMLKFNSKLVSYEFNNEDIIKVRSDLIKYADQITSEKRWMPTQSVLCDWCDFKNTCLNSW